MLIIAAIISLAVNLGCRKYPSCKGFVNIAQYIYRTVSNSSLLVVLRKQPYEETDLLTW